MMSLAPGRAATLQQKGESRGGEGCFLLAFVRFSQLGLRQAFDKPVVLVQESGSEPLFDIAPLRITAYRREMLCREVLEDQEAVAAAVIATREAALDAKSVNSIVRLLGLTHSASLPAVAEGG